MDCSECGVDLDMVGSGRSLCPICYRDSEIARLKTSLKRIRNIAIEAQQTTHAKKKRPRTLYWINKISTEALRLK